MLLCMNYQIELCFYYIVFAMIHFNWIELQQHYLLNTKKARLHNLITMINIKDVGMIMSLKYIQVTLHQRSFLNNYVVVSIVELMSRRHSSFTTWRFH